MSCPQQLIDMHTKLAAHLRSVDTFSSQVMTTEFSVNDEGDGYESPLMTDGSDHPEPTPRGPRRPLESMPSFSEPPNQQPIILHNAALTAQNPAGEADAPLSQLLSSHRRTIESLTKQQQILENQNSSLKKKIEENNLYFKKKGKEWKLTLQLKANETKEKVEAEKATHVAKVIISDGED